jgi:hypothetical protein
MNPLKFAHGTPGLCRTQFEYHCSKAVEQYFLLAS